MKIVVVGPQFRDSFARNIVVTLQSMGHEVTNVSGTRALHLQNRLAHAFWACLPVVFPSLERTLFNELIRTVRRVQPDLVLLTYGLPPEIIRRLRDVSGAKIACWFPDAISNFYRSYLLA